MNKTSRNVKYYVTKKHYFRKHQIHVFILGLNLNNLYLHRLNVALNIINQPTTVSLTYLPDTIVVTVVQKDA